MASTPKEVLEAALGLPPNERAHVAHELLASLDGEEDEGADEMWRDEVIKRAQDVRAGRVALVDGPESFQKIRERLRRP